MEKGMQGFADMEKAQDVTPPPTDAESPELVAQIKGQWWRFLDYTSTHGIPHIKRFDRLVGRMFWSVASLAMLGMLLYQVITLVIIYFKFEYNVLVEVTFDRNLKFPAVTMCNMNPFRMTRIANEAGKDPHLKSIMDGFQKMHPPPPPPPPPPSGKRRPLGSQQRTTPKPTSSAPRSYSSSPTPTMSNGNESAATTEEDSITEEDEEDQDFWRRHEEMMQQPGFQEPSQEGRQKKQDILDRVTNMPYKKKVKMGHPLESMLVSCDFNKESCGPQNFSWVYNYQYGSCYTFNSFNNSANLTASRAGPLYGLTLEIYIELSEYVFDLQDSVGLRVLVHDQNKVPLPEDSGFTVAPGYLSEVGIRRFQNRRLGYPYFECAYSSLGGEKNLYSTQIPNSYTSGVCMRSCYQVKLVQECGCHDPAYPINREVFPYDVQRCNNSVPFERDCSAAVWGAYTSESLDCDCLQVCNDVKYFTTISTSIWPAPNKEYEQTLIRSYLQSGHPAIRKLLKSGQETEKAQHLRDQLLKIKVYYEDLNYEEIYQKEAYSGQQLMSDIGGQLGLWLGLSLLSAMEYVELLCFMILTACRRGSSEYKSF